MRLIKAKLALRLNLLLLLLVGGAALAESADPDLGNDKQAAESKNPIVQRLEWEAELAASGHELNPTKINRSLSAQLYEQLAYYTCMPHLHAQLNYEASELDEGCLKYLDKVKKYDPKSPAVDCIMNGIDSEACRKAHEREEIATPSRGSSFGIMGGGAGYNNNAGYSKLTAMSLDRELDANPKVIEMGEEYKVLKRKLRHVTGPEAGEEYLKFYSKYIPLVCSNFRLELLDEDPAGTTSAILDEESEKKQLPIRLPAETASKDSVKNDEKPASMDDVLEALERLKKGTPAHEQNKVAVHRRRYLASRCKQAIDSALRVDMDYATAICYSDGLYTPACISALRKARSAVKAKPTTEGQAAPQEGGLGTF